MSIEFTSGQWQDVRESASIWWAGQLVRPLISVRLEGRDPGRTKPETPLLGQSNCHDFSIPPDRIIDRIDYELSATHFLGDAFPCFNMHCFGPGIAAGFLGATVDNSSGGVWFHPPERKPIGDIRFEFNPDNPWFRRICAIYQAGMNRWQGQVLMTMTDLGGILDILSTFRPGEELLLDLLDEPEEVKRLVREAHEAWHQYYLALNEVLQPVNPGYSDWSLIYSEVPCYILQSDFSYMIGVDMFEEFVLPELAASCRRLPRSFYHLDGKGQIPHLDSLLRIPELSGVQWIPGAGAPDCRHWPEIYGKIAAANKRIQLVGGFDVLDEVIRQLGSGRGICINIFGNDSVSEMRRILDGYGIT